MTIKRVPLPTTKKCFRCGEVKLRTVEFFYKANTSDGLNNACKPCVVKEASKYYNKNKRQCKETQAKWRQANKEYIKVLQKRYNRSRYIKSEIAKERKRKQDALRRRSNPEVFAFYSANRKALKLLATPSWADNELMELVYAEAEHRGLVVDHFVPLQGVNVCGLHVYYNTQLLTKEQNSIKSNKWPYESK